THCTSPPLCCIRARSPPWPRTTASLLLLHSATVSSSPSGDTPDAAPSRARRPHGRPSHRRRRPSTVTPFPDTSPIDPQTRADPSAKGRAETGGAGDDVSIPPFGPVGHTPNGSGPLAPGTS